MKAVLKLFVVFLLFQTTHMFSQKETLNVKNKEIPTSIYSSTLLLTNLNSTYHINNRLKLSSYKFMVLDEKIVEEGYFSIPFYKINESPTRYIYDSYNKIQHNLNLKQAFFKVSDLYKVRVKNPF